MSNALKISQDESRQIGAILALQGYVKQCAEDGVWMTTINGEAVSDSKPPHFSLARVHKALADLQNRISSNNVDRRIPCGSSGRVRRFFTGTPRSASGGRRDQRSFEQG